VSGMLNYWTPGVAAPARVLPPARHTPDSSERADWLTMAVVVCISAAGAFCIVIGMAWVMGG
jgi:hypothetical protein